MCEVLVPVEVVKANEAGRDPDRASSGQYFPTNKTIRCDMLRTRNKLLCLLNRICIFNCFAVGLHRC